MAPAHKTTKTQTGLSARKRLAFTALLIAISACFALVIAEVALRIFPIPGITYHTFYYDDVTGGKLYPHTTYMYRNARGDIVNRRINAWGFQDVEHELVPAPGTLRIGIFGDSYTQAAQVPIDSTYFRLTERTFNTRAEAFRGLRNTRGEPVTHVEVVAFGISGRGTLQSYLECDQWMDRADLDVVLYVFVENDPGDNLRAIKRDDTFPFAELSGDTFVVDNTFDDIYGYKSGRLHRTIQFIKSNSLVISTLEGRLKLLLRYGVKTQTTAADFEGGVGPGGRSGQAPSSWQSDSLVTVGWELTERIITRWRHDVETQGREFVMARVPRSAMVLVPLDEQDSWAPRLHAYCDSTGIDLVDPTPVFAPHQAGGEEVYYDHFTTLGHRLFAGMLVDYFLNAWEKTR